MIKTRALFLGHSAIKPFPAQIVRRSSPQVSMPLNPSHELMRRVMGQRERSLIQPYRFGYHSRSFSTKAEEPEIEIEKQKVASDQDAPPEDDDAGNQLIAQHRLIPVAEHPLFPGSSQALQLSQD